MYVYNISRKRRKNKNSKQNQNKKQNYNVSKRMLREKQKMEKSIKKSLALGTMGAAALAAVVVPTASAAVNKYNAVIGGNFSAGVFRVKRTITDVTSDSVTTDFKYSVEYMANASEGSESPALTFGEQVISFNATTPVDQEVTGYFDLDFSAWKPSAGVGDYYYLIKETEATGEGYKAYTDYGYILAISVRNANDSAGATETADIKVASQLYLVSKEISATSSDFNAISKVDGIITTNTQAKPNSKVKHYLSLINKNSGDMADIADCFVYTIKIDSNDLTADDDISLNVNGGSCYTEGEEPAPTKVKGDLRT